MFRSPYQGPRLPAAVELHHAQVHYIIRGALERAACWRYLGVNDAAMAEAPSPKKSPPDPPSPAEAATLPNEAWQDPEWGLLLCSP